MRPAKAIPWIGSAIDLLYPRNCQICLTAMGEAERGVICGSCLAQAKVIEPPCCARCALPFEGAVTQEFTCGYCAGLKFSFSRAVAACTAEKVAREAIHRLKYQQQMYFAEHLVTWLAAAAKRWVDWSAVDGIVPVPLYPRKKRERGFNQAEVLAEGLSLVVNVPVFTKAVRRVKDTPTQTRLDREQRAANLRRAFAVCEPAAVKGKRLVLVDDVFTTGATLDSCAKVLLAAGATNVMALTVARGV